MRVVGTHRARDLLVGLAFVQALLGACTEPTSTESDASSFTIALPTQFAFTGSAGAVSADDRSPEGTCARWNADYVLTESVWSGSVGSCDRGDVSAEGRAAALRILNLYRWLAGLPAVQTDPDLDHRAQACALLMRANESISHDPPRSWACWSEDAAQAARRSSLSTGELVSSIGGFVVDPGARNAETLGHRRFMLGNRFGPTGLGGTDRGACLWAVGTSELDEPWTAWPGPRAFPLQAMSDAFGRSLDETGWSLQSDRIDLGSAQVTVSAGGASLPVSVTRLRANVGSRYALRFNPIGWHTEPGKTYAVSVTGASEPIDYEVQVVDCR